MEHNRNQECFVSTFSRLRESSKDAVVSADFSDEYTMYMHVDRPVQEAFVAELEKAAKSDGASLILLCGSVGDGKSHMLSYCREKYPEMMGKFYVHNDSTASLYVDKPASYTLKEVLGDFSDARIEQSDKKVILAINLGTLNNFLEEDRENRFSELKKYVEQSGILEEEVSGAREYAHFYSVNFADYHLYELTADGPKSSYISGLLNKITQKDRENIFYRSYCECCKTCDTFEKCPVRINYDLLSDPAVQAGVIDALIESIVKNKLLVSTRALLNFIYDIVVDERVFKRGSLEPRKEALKITGVAYCRALLPNMLFGRRESSEILNSMKMIDPLRIRNEKIDNFFVFYENMDDVLSVFREYLEPYAECVGKFKGIKFSEFSTRSLREELLHLFIRLCRLTGRRKDLLQEDEDYTEYMKALYCWNTGDAKGLKQVYGMTERALLLWNGTAGKGEMQLPIGNTKSLCRLLQKIEIRQIIDNLPQHAPGILYSFRDELRLKYKDKNMKRYGGVLDLDFALYTLLKNVLNGYVPSVNDKRVNVKCTEFVKNIARGGSGAEEVMIMDLSGGEVKEYQLKYDEDYGNYSFEEL